MSPGHFTELRQFRCVLSPDGQRIRAFTFELGEEGPRGPFAFHQAVVFYRIHEVKKHFRQTKSLVELSDDVVSACYDPGDGTRRIFGLYALGNILEPRLGLFQMIGARGFGRTRDEALQNAERDAQALLGLMEGKFRQIVMKPLTVEEGVTFYEHLRRCRNVAAVIGLPVRRVAAGHGDMDLAARLQAQEMQEQMEVIAAACADMPFQVFTWFDPLTFEDITGLLTATARELSKWASEVKGTRSMNLSAIIPALFRPTFEYMSLLDRQVGGLRSAAAEHAEQMRHLAHMRREAQVVDAGLTRHSEADYARHDHVVTDESSRLHERGTEHENTVEALDRQSDLSWSTSVGRTIHESGVVRVEGDRRVHQAGHADESQHLDEHEVAGEQVHQVSDARFHRETARQESIDEHMAGHEHREIDDSYGWGESYGGSEGGFRGGVRTLSGHRDLTHELRDAHYDTTVQEAGGGHRNEDITSSFDTESRHAARTERQFSSVQGETASGSQERNYHGGGHAETLPGSYREVWTQEGVERMEQTIPGQARYEHSGQLERRYEGSLGGYVAGLGAGRKGRVGESEQYSYFENPVQVHGEGYRREMVVEGQDRLYRGEQSEQFRSHEQRAVHGGAVEGRVVEDTGHEFSTGGRSTGFDFTQAAERHSQSTGREVVAEDYGGREVYGDSYNFSYGGHRGASGHRHDSVDVGFDRTQHTDRAVQATMDGMEHRVEDVARDAVRDSQTDRGIQRDWGIRIGEQEASVRHFSGVTSQAIAESGHTAARLRQLSRIARDTAFERDVAAERHSDLTARATGQSTENLRQQDHLAAQSAVKGQEVAATAADGRGQMLRVVDGITRGTRMLSGFGMGGTPYLTASVGRTLQTYDALKDLHVRLLTMQLERLKAAQDTGLFHTDFYIATYTDTDLQRLAKAVEAALREENVVSPLHVRSFDEERQKDLHHHLICMHPCPEREVVGLWQIGTTSELLVSNELGAIVHPLRVDGHGGISTTVEAVPTTLRVPANMKGETRWGRIYSPTTGKLTRNQFRVGRKDFMHLIDIGGSGSGKSNLAQWILAEVMNRLREDERGNPIPAPVRQVGPFDDIADLRGDHGRPQLGATVFDPGGDWRRLLRMVDTRECSFYSLTNPKFRPLYFNPLRIPSPYISPDRWAELVAKRWAIAYSTGSTGFHAIKTAILSLYREYGVYDPHTGHVDRERSRDIRMYHLYDRLQDMRGEKARKRSKQDISIGVIDRILEKLEDFTPEVGGSTYRMYSAHEGTTVEVWMPEHHLTILEGAFEDDNLKAFIISLMGSACFLHARGRFEAHGHDTTAFAPHILVFEEAHEVMESEERELSSGGAAAVEKGTTIWNKMFDQGRKIGLHVWGIGQRLKALPEGLLSSARITIVGGLDDADDIKLAVTKMAKVTTGMSEDVPWMRLFQRMPVGYAVVKFSRLARWRDMEPVLVKFPKIVVKPPTNEEIDYLLEMAEYIYAGSQEERRRVLEERLRQGKPVPRAVFTPGPKKGPKEVKRAA